MSTATETGNNFRLIAYSLGVIVSFTLFGYAQEAVTRTEFGAEKERFTFTSVLIVIQCVGNALVAALFLKWQNKSLTGGVPMKDVSVVSCGAFGAHFFGLLALRHIPFPMQVVCKSCKSIPVMFGESIFAGKTHTLARKIQVLLMTVGVIVFTLSGKKAKGESHLSFELFMGIAFVMLALVCDGIYGPYQNKISKQYNPSSFNLMFNLNAGEGLLALIICIADGSLVAFIPFVQRHIIVFAPLLIQFSVCMALGNAFLFKLQSDFGALTVTITTTVRKMVSVIFSVFLFGHYLLVAQWGAATLVFLASPISNFIVSKIGSAPSKDSAKRQ
eukprot:GEMP01029206.1.p1 GENE.GEMP01029206.1~~GEMP01029206.1.p1  ORF type:complete len:330 (+),score=41.51 GEMP01029206.1:195-1184(+)